MRRVVLATPLVLVVAGCGGSSSSAAGGGASVVPANVRSFVAVAAGAPLDQLRTVLPKEAGVVARARRADHGEIDVAELANGRIVTLMRTHGKWAPTFAGPHLAEATAYREAQAKVADGASIRGYLSPAAAALLVRSVPGQLQIVQNPARHPFPLRRPLQQLATRRFPWGAVELAGGRFSTLVRSLPPSRDAIEAARQVEIYMPSYVPHLLDEIPADATDVTDFQAPPSMLENLDPSVLSTRIRKLIDASPQLPSEIDELIGGETALYRRAGGEVTLVTQPADTRVVSGTLAAVERELQITATLHHAFLGGELIVSTSQRGIDVFRGDGVKLAGSTAFEKSVSAARLPPRTTGFTYRASPATVGWGEHDGGLIRFVSVVR
jgi:hypothetical protein